MVLVCYTEMLILLLDLVLCRRPFTTNVHSTYKPENELHGEDLAQAEAH